MRAASRDGGAALAVSCSRAGREKMDGAGMFGKMHGVGGPLRPGRSR